MLNFAAAGLIGMSCFMTGVMLVMRMRARLKLIEAWQCALRQIADEMCLRLKPANEALKAYRGVDKCRVWLNTLSDAPDIGRAWALLMKSARTVPLMPEDFEVLSALIPELGTLDLAGQRAAFAQAQSGLALCREHARADLEKNARVYTTLGSLGGMLAAILII